MPPRSATNHAAPASLLADALSAFQKAAGNALAAADEQAKLEVAQARAERDEARRLMHDAKLQCKDWERRGEVSKSNLEKAELTINHQTETIAQLREEAHQWKNQLLRFEEASRREIRDWKEQYLRAEQERTRLALRLDELVAEQLEWTAMEASTSTLPQTPHRTQQELAHHIAAQKSGQKSGSKTARPSVANASQTASVRKSKANTATSDRERTYVEVDVPSLPPTPKAVTGSRTPKQKATADKMSNGQKTPAAARPSNAGRPSTSMPELYPAQSQVIRRVKAVIEVPVKEEDDDDAFEPESDSSSYEPPPRPAKYRRASGKQRSFQESESEEDEDEDEGPDQLLLMSEDDYNEPLTARQVKTPTSRKRKLDTEAVRAQKVPRKK